jgi:spore maturation protein CgeB
MKIAIFCHSLVSDWNHGNAHFLRGIAAELLDRGCQLSVYEPAGAWSVRNLLDEYGPAALDRFAAAFPRLRSARYDVSSLDLDEALDADLVLVHEWNDHDLVRRIGAHAISRRRCRVLFHDTHHRSVTDPRSMSSYDLSGFDGVLAFGEAIRQVYLQRGWTGRAWTWHEAADTRLFRPMQAARQGDLIWIGNWGDGERCAELQEFLLEPVRSLGLCARVYGVRYPAAARQALAQAGIQYGGWLPNYEVPSALAAFTVTVHIPRRPYVEALPGIPTIRVFEALACGIPLVSAPWHDAEALFSPGDYLVARNALEMRESLRLLLHDPVAREELARRGRATVTARHTCSHRVDELLGICNELGLETRLGPESKLGALAEAHG